MDEAERAQRVWTKVVGSAALGAAAMFVLDPDKGRRRRAIAHDKARWIARRTGDLVDAATRDVRGRWHRARARATRVAHRAEAPSDDVLRERVHARLGRVLPHPHAIVVEASAGRVVLRGPILAREAAHLLDTLRAVPGVKVLEDALERHEGGDEDRALRGESMRRSWTPALRVGAVAGGGLLALYGLRRGGVSGVLMGTIGFCLAARGTMNAPFADLARSPADEAIDVEQAIDVAARPEAAFDAWTHYENFPRFMSHVIEVRDLGNGRSHWIVDGPAGTTLEWDSTITRMVANRMIEWRADPGSKVTDAGCVRFEARDGGTRVTVRMSHDAGAVGRGVAELPGRDIDEDLARMKAFLETGATPHDVASG